MKKAIEETLEKNAIVCEECGLEIKYAELNNGAYTTGGIGIDWEKLGGIKIAEKDAYEYDYHKVCLVKVLTRGEPVELAKVKPELFSANRKEAKE